MSGPSLLLASRNEHKLSELRGLLAETGVELVAPAEVDILRDPAEDLVECWHSFAANALAKASWFRARSGLPTLADDSGLCVTGLGGGPGVRSRRFAPGSPTGPEGQDAANNRHLLSLLAGRPESDREAWYECALAFIDEDVCIVTLGRVDGRILAEPRGCAGFGYDPLFFVPEYGATFGELPPEVKAANSHRAAAAVAMRAWLS